MRRAAMTRLLIALVVAGAMPSAALAGPAAPAASGPTGVSRGYSVLRLDYPRPSASVGGFAVCPPGLVYVAVDGGLALSGIKGWVRERGNRPVKSVACDGEGRLYLLHEDGQLVRASTVKGKQRSEVIAKLPAGSYELAVAGKEPVWIWGETVAREGHLWRWDAAQGLRVVWSGQSRVNGAAPAGRDAVVSCTGRTVILWRNGRPPTVLTSLQRDCDGVAVSPAGEVFVSNGRGVLKLGAKGEPSLVALGMHGSLRWASGRLHVLSKEAGAVFALHPERRK